MCVVSIEYDIKKSLEFIYTEFCLHNKASHWHLTLPIFLMIYTEMHIHLPFEAIVYIHMHAKSIHEVGSYYHIQLEQKFVVGV